MLERLTLTILASGLLALLPPATAPAEGELPAASIGQTIEQVQAKIVKIYGAGGFRGMEPYQSGLLVSPDGHVLTVFSHVLDTDYITATLADGRKLDAKLLGADPRMELALLKVEAAELRHFDLSRAADVQAGTRVLAFSNLFGVATGSEPASVQHGVVSVKTRLAARRGVFVTVYQGPVYVLDAVTNNPGAAGGALVTRDGRLVAVLGKELRNSLNNTWLNYAIPIAEIRPSVEQIRAGKLITPKNDPRESRPERAVNLAMLGVVLVPDVLERTPPYVDHVRRGSPAAKAGLRPDDLVLLVDQRLIQSCKVLRGELETIDHEDPVQITVLRAQELLEFTLQASADASEELP